jgi:branched-subunit amino acid ABC-type transport system permease component
MGEVIVQTLINGPQLALLALGMTLVYSVLRFANVAQVEFATIGAYGTVLAASVIGGGLLLDSIVSMIVVGLLSVALYYGIFTRLLRRNPATAMIGSLALSIVIQALIQAMTGPLPKQLNVPLQRGHNLLGTLVTGYDIRVMVIGAAAAAAVMALLRFTPLGRRIRAVSSNRELAEACGVDAKRVIAIVWFIAGVVGALDGVLIAIETQVSIEMGFDLLLPVFAATLLGGFGSPGGAIIGGYLLALAEAVALQVDWGKLIGSGPALLPTVYRPAVGFVVLIVVLLARPQGLFGRRARRA